MSKAKKFLVNAIILTITTVVLKAIGVVFNVYISGKIGSNGIGIFSLLISVYMFAITLATSGITLATTRLVAEELAVNSHSGIKSAVKKCILYSVSFGILASILLCVLADFIANDWLHGKIEVNSVYLLSATLPFLSITSVFSGYFFAVRRVSKSSVAQMSEQFIRISITIYVLTLFTDKSLKQMITAIIFSGIISDTIYFLIMFILYSMDKKKYTKKDTPNPNLNKRMLNIAVPVALSSYLRSGLATLKQVIIPWGLEKSGVSCDVAMGQYGMIKGMVMPIIFFPSALLSSFSSLLIPEIAENCVHQNNTRTNHIISRIFKITLIFSICVGGILWAYSNELSMAIYKNLEPAPFIKVFAPLVIIMYFDEIVDAILKGLNQQVYVVGVNIADTILSIIMLYTLLPTYSIKGYIAVIIITELFNGFISIYRLIKIMDFEIQIMGWIVLPSISIALAIFASKTILGVNMYISIAVSIILYLLILYLLKIIKKSDFKM